MNSIKAKVPELMLVSKQILSPTQISSLLKWLMVCLFSTQTRPRLSFKRRPPSRQHRRSAGEEGGALESHLSPCELYSPKENRDRDHVFDIPAKQAESRQPASVKDTEEAQERDCEMTEEEGAENAADSRGDQEEAKASEGLEEDRRLSESHPAEEMEGKIKTEEE